MHTSHRAADVQSEAEGQGIAPKTLQRARKALGVEAIPHYQDGKKGVKRWEWRLPGGDFIEGRPSSPEDGGLLNKELETPVSVRDSGVGSWTGRCTKRARAVVHQYNGGAGYRLDGSETDLIQKRV